MKNHADALIVSPSKRSLLWLFVSERKQIALMAEEKSHSRISLRLLATKSLGNEDYNEEKRFDDTDYRAGHMFDDGFSACIGRGKDSSRRVDLLL